MKAILILLISGPTSLNAQSFPEDWIGSYKGTMDMNYTSGYSNRVPVTFTLKTVEPDSVWTYIMEYQMTDTTTMSKDYVIRALSKGDSVNFILDESGGIELEMTYFNNTFYGLFDVLDQLYSTTLSHRGDGIYFDLFSASLSKVTRMDSEPVEGEVYNIGSYKVLLHQSVYLFKDEE